MYQVVREKPYGLKSHTLHCMMQLLACICLILPHAQHIAIIILGKYFARIHAEDIDPRELDALEIIYVHEFFASSRYVYHHHILMLWNI